MQNIVDSFVNIFKLLTVAHRWREKSLLLCDDFCSKTTIDICVAKVWRTVPMLGA
jgi:hypothetical protein